MSVVLFEKRMHQYVYNKQVVNMDISIEGYGGEYQHHKLTVDELEEIIKAFDEDGVDALQDEYFSGGHCFGTSPNPGMYGPEIDYAEVSVDYSSIDGFEEQEDSSNAKQLENASCYADFHYITAGKIYGSSQDIEDDEEFDPSNLVIMYSNYEVEDWLSGKIITGATYKGNPIEFEWGDNGVELKSIVLYEIWEDGEYKDTLRIYYLDEEEGEWVFDREAAQTALSIMKKSLA